ncbi:hypothetical protein J6590_035871 [Homalodisca vitripennis]|nr:hypothetical protein J6590_035871 [Homalodisca vitripennis]
MLFTLGVAWGFHRGVVFEKEGDVLLTDSHWTIVMQYNLTEVEEENQNLSILLFKVKGQYDEFFQDLLARNVSMHSPVRGLEAGFRYEYVGLQQLVADYVGQTSDLTTLVSSTRQKRGLIDVGGQVLKFLFETATHSDLELTNSRINEIENLSDDFSHNTKDQITVLGNMQSEISNHSRAIKKIISTIKEYHEVMHITMARNYIRELIYVNQLRTLFQYLKLNSALSEVKDAINLAVQRMARLHLAIEDLAAGKMTSNLLPPHQFLKVLTSVENSPVLIRTPTRWLYATSKETRVILNCFGRDANLNVSAITLKGEGEIPKQDTCDLIADGYRVPARFIGSSSYSSEFGKIVFPEVDAMYSSEEHSLLVHDGLDDQLGTLSVKEYSLEGTVQLLRSHYHRRMVIKYATFSGTSLVVVLTVVLLLRWRVRVADLLRAALGDSTQHPQAAQTESPLQTLEETVRTVPRSDADQGEIDRDHSGNMSTPRTATDVKLTVRRQHLSEYHPKTKRALIGLEPWQREDRAMLRACSGSRLTCAGRDRR